MATSNKNIIIYYAVSKNHIKNLELLENIEPTSKFYLIKDQNSLLKNFNKNKNILKFAELDRFLQKNYKNIKCAIMSTAQVRIFPIKLLFYFNIYNIRIISFQETHQLYLHNNKLNNYILPINELYVNSEYEKLTLKMAI